MDPRRASRENGGKPSGRRMIACSACGVDHSWCDACQRAICQHIEADSPIEPAPVLAAEHLDRLKAFVVWVLGEISREAELVELTDTPQGTYALRVEVPREVLKPLTVPRCLVESAVAHPLSLRTLRNLLRAQILATGATRATSNAREVFAERFRIQLVCEVCLEPITAHQALRLRQEHVSHIRCAER
jgi:hypothetical protein